MDEDIDAICDGAVERQVKKIKVECLCLISYELLLRMLHNRLLILNNQFSILDIVKSMFEKFGDNKFLSSLEQHVTTLNSLCNLLYM